MPFDPSPGYPGLAVAPLPTGWLAPDLARLLPRVSLSLAPTGLRAPAPPDLAAAGLAGLAAVAAAAVAAAGLARLRRRPTGELMGIYERVQRRLGRPRAPPQTPREYREAVAAGDLRELLDDVTEAVERALYAGRPPTRSRLDDLRRRLRRR